MAVSLQMPPLTVKVPATSFSLLQRVTYHVFLEQIGIDREDCGSLFLSVCYGKEIFGKIKHVLNKIFGALYLPQNDL